MSSFACEVCGAVCCDSFLGYTTGCEHYPVDDATPRGADVSPDELCRGVVAQNPNMCVPWFLMCSILYHREDRPVISDETFDWLCQQAAEHWKTIKHRHKKFIKPGDLVAGTGYALPWRKIPRSVYSAAWALYNRHTKNLDWSTPQ